MRTKSINSCNKRLKVNTDTNKNGEDIISNLPDDIISRILSILPTKDAVRTSVLSKNWEFKWSDHIYNIDIDDGRLFSNKRTKKNSVVGFVDKILFTSRHSTIKNFRLLLRNNYNIPGQFTKWLSIVLRRNVEELDVFYNHDIGILPRCLFHCKTLSELKFQIPCTLRITVKYWFSNLKKLHFFKVNIVNGFFSDTNRFVLDFPVLATLELSFCNWWRMNFVEIKAPTLTRLRVTHNWALSKLEEGQIKISGAKCLNIILCNNFVEYFNLRESSVSSATLDFPNEYFGHQPIEQKGLSLRRILLEGFLGLTHLEITGEVAEAIIQSKQGPPLPLFKVLKRLVFYKKCSIGALLEVLHAMPFLESIVFDMLVWVDHKYNEVESIPSCIVCHLREVEFRHFTGKKQHVQMANFFMTHAVGLRNMLGLVRNRSKERRIEKKFWEQLKNMFKDGDLGLGSSVKTMADFESFFE